MNRIRVLIADDHALLRAGLRALLEAQPDIAVVAEAESGIVVERLCTELAPDIVLMDLAMPGRGGVAAAEDVRRACPDTKVLVLTMHDDEAYARQAALAGASGYVLKKALATELVAAIRTVHGGGRHVAAELAEAFSAVGAARQPGRSAAGGLDRLSEREREVVSAVALGHTNAEIGRRLHISEKTVEAHRAHILRKLGLRTRADLVRFAIEHGLMTA
jgi:two-component system, NarL family, response regulator NreC